MTTAQGSQQQTQQNSPAATTQRTAKDKLREKAKQANQQTATSLQFRGGRNR